MILTEERRITVDISHQSEREELDKFMQKAALEGFGFHVVENSTFGRSSLITVTVTRREESQ